MKNFKSLFMIAGFSVGLIADDSSTVYTKNCDSIRADMELPQVAGTVQSDIVNDIVSSEVIVEAAQEELLLSEKIEKFGKTLSFGNVLEIYNSVPKSARAEHLKDLYFQAYPPTTMQKVTGAAMFTAVVGSYLAYSYVYPSIDKDSEESDKN